MSALRPLAFAPTNATIVRLFSLIDTVDASTIPPRPTGPVETPVFDTSSKPFDAPRASIMAAFV
jgi:hypothetical protein